MLHGSIGQIVLDLVINQNGFNRQLTGIQNLAKKAGLALAAAFSVKGLIDFGAECIELGSRLAEVENVIQQAVPSMESKIDAFAKSAILNFGMSETAAKQFTGVFASMARGFGFSEESAAAMGTTLTALAADVASFYDTSQDEAFVRLKGIFTGETVALKSLGIVMTQNALDSYAMANGYKKKVKAMSEAERVALRYAYVQEQLRFANGDFARTSGNWANQVRILSEQFNALKATIGQGLINVLSPVIQVINTIISKLMSLANAFKAFTEMLTGRKNGAGAAAKASLGEIEDAAGGASDAIGGAGGAAKKAAADIKGVTTGIDELNIIDPNSGSGGGSGGGGGYTPDEFEMGDFDTTPIEELEGKYAALIDRLLELKDLFVEGFKIGFGDVSVLDSIKGHLDGIKKSLLNIVADSEVKKAAERFVNTFVKNLGKMAGSVASVGATIADNLLGGLDKYLQQNSERIKQFLISIFDIGSESAEIVGNFYVAVADIFTVFRSDEAKQITADIMAVFAEAYMGITELSMKAGRDVVDALITPIVSNKENIKTALSETIGAIAPTFETIKLLAQECFSKLNALYDEHVKPMIESFKKGFTDIGEKMLEVYTQYFAPVIQEWSEKFEELREQYLSPLIDKFMEFAGAVADAISVLWGGVLRPFLLWCIENIGPRVSEALLVAERAFFNLGEAVSVIIGTMWDFLSGLIEFLHGVFTGDWERAWKGVEKILDGVWNLMKQLVDSAITTIANKLGIETEHIKQAWEIIWNKIKEFTFENWEKVREKAAEIFEGIRDKLAEIWDAVKAKVEEKWNEIKTFMDEIWIRLKEIFRLDEMVQIGEGIMTKLWDGMKSVWESVREWLSNIADFVGGVWDGIVDGAKKIVKKAMADAEDDGGGDDGGDLSKGGPGAKGHATGGFPESGSMFVANENGKSEYVGSWGGRAAVANNAQITEGITRAVQYGMRSAIAPLVNSVSAMAASAAPPLAMVGSAAPAGGSMGEEQLQGIVSRAVAMAGSVSSRGEEFLATAVDLLGQLVDLVEAMDLTVSIDVREIRDRLGDLEKRSGYVMRKK